MDPQLKSDLIAILAVAGPLIAAWIKAKIDETKAKNAKELALSQRETTDAQTAGFILSLAQRSQILDEQIVGYEMEAGAAARREVTLQSKLGDCKSELEATKNELIKVKTLLEQAKNEPTTTA